MGTFLRYLISFAMHLAWQRSGKGGAVPPLRLPFGKDKGKTIPLPTIAPWQVMAALWLAQRIWSLYGAQFKKKLLTAKHPLAGHLHDLLPDTPDTASSTAGSAMSTPSTRPAPQYHTQPLAGAASDSNDSGVLPAGSVLSGLRRAS